jgi:hypothetical protein
VHPNLFFQQAYAFTTLLGEGAAMKDGGTTKVFLNFIRWPARFVPKTDSCAQQKSLTQSPHRRQRAVCPGR